MPGGNCSPAPPPRTIARSRQRPPRDVVRCPTPEAPGLGEATDPVERRRDDRALYCAQCLAPVTTEDDRLARHGSHRHIFSNPHGLVFEIGCFARAPGCVGTGSPTPDFSWFPGTHWRIVLCARCGRHLGWHYTGHPDGPFYGLILPRLRAGAGR